MVGKNEDRQLKTPEDMLALAEELAARHPIRAVHVVNRRSWTGWLGYGLWFLGGAGTASLVWWLSFL